MKKITKKQFLADVMHEINMLKLHATTIEKGKLDFYYFNPESPRNCIYGQITGDCRSSRAKQLIDTCCIRVIDTTLRNVNKGSFDLIKDLINGEYTGQMWDSTGSRKTWVHLSSLEGYIQLENTEVNRNIIAYIKGETDTLKLQ